MADPKYTSIHTGSQIDSAVGKALPLDDFEWTTDTAIDQVTYHILWRKKPTSSNTVYGITVSPVDGKFYTAKSVNNTITITEAGHTYRTPQTAAAVKVGTDSTGHVVIGAALGGTATSTNSEHSHSFSNATVDIAKNKVVTGINPTATRYTWTLAAGTNNANIATVAKRKADQITYGNANVGTEISIWGLKTKTENNVVVADTTTASKATSAGTITYGNADTGTEVRGIAKRGGQITYGNANVGSPVSIWGIKTKTVSDTIVADTTTASKASSAGSITYGNANVGAQVTGLAKRGDQISWGDANYKPTATSVMDGFQSSGVAYQASYDSTNERLKLTALTPNIVDIHEATKSSNTTYGCTSDQVDIYPAAESQSTLTTYSFSNVTVPKAADAISTVTQAAESSDKAYVCGDTVDIIPAKSSTSTLTTYSFSNVTVPKAADAINKFKPATTSSDKAYVCDDTTADVFKSSTTISVNTVNSGGTALITGVTADTNAVSSAGTASGSTDTDGAHSHSVTIS